MNKRTRVVHEGHRLRFSKFSSVGAGDERYSQAVETGINPTGLEHLINSAVLVLTKFACLGYTATFELKKQGRKFRVNRHGKILSRVILASFCIAQSNGASLQVNVLKRDGAFAEPATSVETDFKSYSHPLRLSSEFTPDYFDLVIRQFGLELLGSARDAKFCQRVTFGKLPADSFVEKMGEKLEFKQRRVVADLSTMNCGGYPPAHVSLTVSVFNLAGVKESLTGKECPDGLPCAVIPSPRVGGFGCVMRGDVAGNPNVECGIDPNSASFLDAIFVSEPVSLSRVTGRVDAQTGRMFFPRSNVVSTPNVPVGGTPMFAQRCQRLERVSTSLHFVKWNRVDLPQYIPGLSWETERYRYTTRHWFPSCKTVKVSTVSPLGLNTNGRLV